MRAFYYEKMGAAADVLEFGELAMPEPGPGELRVRLHASSINPICAKMRGGLRPDMPAPQVIPNADGAGIVDKVGPGVPEARVGERVWLYHANRDRPDGTAAEYVVVPQIRATLLPESVAFTEATCLGVPFMTAHRCLFADGPIEGLNVLVTGGAGAVGNAAVQLAKWAGAAVVATVSSDEKAEAARAAGADHIVNYRTEDVAARVKETVGGVDRIVEVDFGGNLATTLEILNPNAYISVYASDGERTPAFPVYRMLFINTTVRVVGLFGIPEDAKARATAEITALAGAGRLRYPIGATFGFKDMIAAHEAVDNHSAMGLVTVEID